MEKSGPDQLWKRGESHDRDLMVSPKELYKERPELLLTPESFPLKPQGTSLDERLSRHIEPSEVGKTCV